MRERTPIPAPVRKLNLYSVDIKLCATAYIKAESEEEAMQIAKQTYGEAGEGVDGAELPTGEGMNIIVDGTRFGPDMPEVSISPAVAFYGPWSEKTHAELVENDINLDRDEDGEVVI
jgi:hypothetical protein